MYIYLNFSLILKSVNFKIIMVLMFLPEVINRIVEIPIAIGD